MSDHRPSLPINVSRHVSAIILFTFKCISTGERVLTLDNKYEPFFSSFLFVKLNVCMYIMYTCVCVCVVYRYRSISLLKICSYVYVLFFLVLFYLFYLFSTCVSICNVLSLFLSLSLSLCMLNLNIRHPLQLSYVCAYLTLHFIADAFSFLSSFVSCLFSSFA